MNKKSLRRSEDGLAALVAIIVITSATLLISYSAAMLGLGELDMGYKSQKGAEAFSVADGCMEETLRRIGLDTGYGVGLGTINLSVSNGTCTIDVSDLGGDQRRVVVKGTTSDFNRSIQVDLSLSGSEITIDSWEELSA